MKLYQGRWDAARLLATFNMQRAEAVRRQQQENEVELSAFDRAIEDVHRWQTENAATEEP